MSVTAFPTGKKIAEEIQEYPYPQKSGVKDYVFYLVSESDGYGKMARVFFNKYYQKHVPKEAGSLEAVIDILDSEIVNGNVSQIREIVLVAHGNAIALIFQVLAGSLTGDQQIYRNLHIFSLLQLQIDFNASKFAAFNTKRKRVISKLYDGSTITLRACNFGQAEAGMYGLYSFFGGRANVYAPTVYQVFGKIAIGEDFKIENNLEMHEHLVKQRFLPKDVHTDYRKDILSRYFSDPQKFAEPFVLGSVKITDSTSAQAIEYEELVDVLNAKNLSPLLKTKFASGNMELSATAKVNRLVKDASWTISDQFVHEEEKYKIRYIIGERIENVLPANEKTAFLDVQASLDEESVKAAFSMQLFLDKEQHDTLQGKIFVLASSSITDAAANQQFQDFLQHLETQSQAGAAIAAVFEQNEITISPNTALTVIESSGSGEFRRKTWLLASSPKYHIKLENLANADLTTTHVLAVYHVMTKKQKETYVFKALATIGIDLDNPGTELMSYLDGFTIEQLLDFMSYLRENYRQEYAIYLDQASKAIERKKEYSKWLFARPEFGDPNQVFFVLPNELSANESDDLRELVYKFETNTYWKGVKVSNPSPIPISSATDLFTEELLTARLNIDPTGLLGLGDMDIDSPYADVEVLRQLAPAELHKYFDKDDYIPQPGEADISCEEFRILLEKLKSLAAASDAELEDAFDNMVILGDKKLGYYLSNIYKSVKTALGFFPISDGTGGIMEMIASKILSRFPALGIGATEITVPFLITITRALPYVGIVTFVWSMFANYLHELENTLKHWEQLGKLTAVRQWARRLYRLSIKHADDFPETINIDLVAYKEQLQSIYGGLTYVNNEYFVTLYYQEQIDEVAGVLKYSAFIFAPDNMKKGFDEGVALMEKEAAEVLSKAEEILDRALTEQGLDPCKINVLKSGGYISMASIRAIIMRQYASLILDKTPKM